MQAFGSLRRGTKPAAEAGWLLKIAQNVCIARWRDGRRARAAELPGDPGLLEAVAPSREHDALVPQDLIEAVAELPDLQRRAILLREWQGLSYQEIADELGVSVAAVETMIFRARRRVADALRERAAVGAYVLSLGSLLGGGAAFHADRISARPAAVAELPATVLRRVPARRASPAVATHRTWNERRPRAHPKPTSATASSPPVAEPPSPKVATPIESETARRRRD